jgi:hypothetical protein
MTPVSSSSGLRRIQADAKKLDAYATTEWGKAFLHAAASLPDPAPRTLLHDADKTHWFSETEAHALPLDQKRSLVPLNVDSEFYYNTRYGSPLAYVRALDVVAAAKTPARTAELAGSRILDFGFGGIGHLRMLANLGADATGIDVDPMLRALYASPGDQGAVGDSGRLQLIIGHFPADTETKNTVGTGFDLFVSKNVLKRGYIHPTEPVADDRLVHLGVDDSTFAATVFALLKPGGFALIYNLCPAPAPPGKPYIPWADGHSPFPQETWARAGFRIVAFDQDDTEKAKEMARLLGWDGEDQGDDRIDIDHDLFAWFTLLERPGP